MTTIRFGEAFKVHYERLIGSGKTEQHMSEDPIERMLQEMELEQQTGDRLTLTVNTLNNRPAKVVMTPTGNHLLTDGPTQNSLSAYEQALSSLPQTHTLDEFIFNNQKLNEQLEQQGVLQNTADLKMQYRVGKNTKSEILHPVMRNLDSILAILKEKGII